MFNDPLFVRVKNGVSPTPLARDLIGPVRKALGILDNLGRLRHTNARGAMHTCRDNTTVNGRNDVQDLFGLPGNHLNDLVNGMLSVTGVNSFRGVPQEEVNTASLARFLLDEGATDLFGDTGVNR